MADNDRLPERIVDALKDIEEFAGIDARSVAKKAFSAYTAQAAAIGLTLPLVVGGPAALSQEQTRRPDENIPAHGQETAQPMRSLMVATTSADSFSISSVESESRKAQSIYIVRQGYIEVNHQPESVDSPESRSSVEDSHNKTATEP
jgi:hypothetical protein